MARRVYVPANGSSENATFPNGQYVALDDAGTVAATADSGEAAMAIPPEVPIVVVSHTICCRIVRLVLVLDVLGSKFVKNASSIRFSASSSSFDLDNDTVVTKSRRVGGVLMAVVGFDTNACSGDEANTTSGNRNSLEIIAAAATMVNGEIDEDSCQYSIFNIAKCLLLLAVLLVVCVRCHVTVSISKMWREKIARQDMAGRKIRYDYELNTKHDLHYFNTLSTK